MRIAVTRHGPSSLIHGGVTDDGTPNHSLLHVPRCVTRKAPRLQMAGGLSTSGRGLRLAPYAKAPIKFVIWGDSATPESRGSHPASATTSSGDRWLIRDLTPLERRLAAGPRALRVGSGRRSSPLVSQRMILPKKPPGLRENRPGDRGGGGNRTRVLRPLNRTSPSAASFRLSGSLRPLAAVAIRIRLSFP